MSVRKQHNRYRTEPYGRNYKNVLKRGKAFFTIGGEHYSFEMSQYHGIWTAHERTLPGCCSPEGTIIRMESEKKEMGRERISPKLERRKFYVDHMGQGTQPT